MATITIAGKKVPLKVIENYIRHLRQKRISDIMGYELERERLHNTIFVAAGFGNSHPDFGDKIPPRKIAALVSLGSFLNKEDDDLRNFNKEFENLLTNVMGCPNCNQTLNRDQICYKCGKFISVNDHISQLHKLVLKKKKN